MPAITQPDDTHDRTIRWANDVVDHRWQTSVCALDEVRHSAMAHRRTEARCATLFDRESHTHGPAFRPR